MSTQFIPNTVAFGDAIGLSEWAVGHYRQHLRYQQVLAAQTPAIVLPDYPLLRVGDDKHEIKFWLDAHETLHELLRPLANITSANLADFDYTKPDFFYEWMDVHNVEHGLLDTAFGVS